MKTRVSKSCSNELGSHNNHLRLPERTLLRSSGCSRSRLDQNFLQRIKISPGQRPIPTQVVNHRVLLTRLEKLMCLVAVFAELRVENAL
jgi:hypothetical protein